jgi:cobalt-zinc-cadmium efflux system membrane fusion protein
MLRNESGDMAPGDLVVGQIDLEKIDVPLAVDNRALQDFRDWRVVFIKVGNTYEIRPLELGRSDGRLTEVLDGLNAGDHYVVENSYLIKADIEKSGASHDH